MVSKVNTSRYNVSEPPEDGESRKIAGGPLYPANDVLELLKGEDVLRVETRRCYVKVQELGFDDGDLSELIELALTSVGGRYKKSEWCDTGNSNYCVACDVYTVNRLEYNEQLRRDIEVQYYLKFSIGITGKVIILIQCHV